MLMRDKLSLTKDKFEINLISSNIHAYTPLYTSIYTSLFIYLYLPLLFGDGLSPSANTKKKALNGF